MLAPDHGYLGAHHGAIESVVVEQFQTPIVAGDFQIVIQEEVRESRQTTGLEIHDGEGDLIHGVDPAEIRVELDAIKEPWASLEKNYVAEMKVTMALPHESRFGPRREVTQETLLFLVRPFMEGIERGAVSGSSKLAVY